MEKVAGRVEGRGRSELPGGPAAEPDAGPLVDARGLEKEYRDGPRTVRVFSGIDFQVEVGETVAIVGESGVGKSTLLHLLGGLDRPTGGSVRVDGLELGELGDADLARFRSRSIGFVFQFHHLLADFSALENVMMPLRIGGASLPVARRQATEMLDRVGLAERLTHRPGELSGGEQQRVAIARATVHRPRLLLADEPTGNLDPHTGEGVEKLIGELNRESGVTVIAVTHSSRLAQSMGRTVRMALGLLEAA